MSPDRRAFLRNVSLASAGIGLAGLVPRTAQAQTWGQLPTTATWPTPSKVLEIFCYSGLSQWETFWVMPGAGGGVNFQNFDVEVANLAWFCGTAGPSPVNQTTPFGNDASGTSISWGPATKPLWRSDIRSRTRMVALAHGEFAHALAIPLALTGQRLGNPRAAGMGAAVQHQQISIAPRTVPYAYVIASASLPWEFTVGAAAANGTHPGYAQPLIIRTGDATLLNQLQRSNATPASDDLLRTYQAMELDRLRYQGHDAVRSTGFSSYSSSLDSVLKGLDLYNQLSSNPNLLAIPQTQPCTSTGAGQLGVARNDVSTELGLATFLLTSAGARYACVIDHGIDLAAGVPYDLHGDTPQAPFERILSNNVFNLCSLLADRIDPSPGTDPTKINLNDTLIIIHSEFGRTPFVDSGGRNHWPSGYAAILIGGPAPLTGSNNIVGGIDTSGVAFGPGGPMSAPFSPTDIRGAMLIAAGVDPTAQENYGVGDFTSTITSSVSGLSGVDAIRQNLKTKILGL